MGEIKDFSTSLHSFGLSLGVTWVQTFPVREVSVSVPPKIPRCGTTCSTSNERTELCSVRELRSVLFPDFWPDSGFCCSQKPINSEIGIFSIFSDPTKSCDFDDFSNFSFFWIFSIRCNFSIFRIFPIRDDGPNFGNINCQYFEVCANTLFTKTQFVTWTITDENADK